ncbi:NACHT domain-containing protein [Lachnospiraceae bacterium LCP25S3_G4]
MGTELDINKISADVITDLAKTTAQTLYKKAISYVTDIQKKEEIDFGYAYENYLNYSKSIHEKIKTLLYRHSPKDIYSFYECVGLNRNGQIIDASDISNILEIGNKFIVTGTGGIGKSVMMKHFFLNVLQNTNYIPILIELRGLNEFDEKSVNLVDYIYSIMETLKFKLERKYFDYSLETGCYVILLDGFDEVKNELSKQVTSQIFTLSEKYPDNQYILSSRPLDEFVGWNQFEELHSMPLSKEQALSLIAKIDYEPKIKDKFYRELEEYLYDKYKTFASNPLLLTIMLLTFENRASIPDKLNDFFEQAFTTLFHTHDATKGGYKRDIQSKLGYEDFKAVFSYFCFKSFFNSEYKFTENRVMDYIGMAKKKNVIDASFNAMDYLKDMTNSVCMLFHEGLEYRFSHRSFQEYFAALYTTQLDDTQQKKFLKLWLQDNSYRATSNYLDMLYELQPLRFQKNIIIPAIRELQALYEKNGESEEWLINLMYEDVCVRKYKDGKKRCAVSIKDFYFHDMIMRACNIGGLYKSIKEEREQQNNERENKLIDFIENKYGLDQEVKFIELKKNGLMSGTIQALHWIIERYEFAIKYVEIIDKDPIARKRRFSSMLDEL